VSDEKQSSIVTKSQATGTTSEEEVVKKKGKKRKSVDVVDAGEESTFTPRDYNQKEFNELLDGRVLSLIVITSQMQMTCKQLQRCNVM